MVDFLAAARSADPTTFALLLTQSDPKPVTSMLREAGFGDDDFFVGRVLPGEIPQYLSAADFGLSFVKASYATQSRSPTKIPEYLAAGLPIVANSGVGDVDKLITDYGVGILIDSFDRREYTNAIQRIKKLNNIKDKCRDTAERI